MHASDPRCEKPPGRPRGAAAPGARYSIETVFTP
jgi:hypothetical protein